MIKADTLIEFRPAVRYRDGANIDLNLVQNAITNCAKESGIPVGFYNEKVGSGSLFSPTLEDCIVLWHPEHKGDYFRFCIRVSHQGSYAFVTVHAFGQSSQMAKVERSRLAKQDRKGKSLSYKLGSKLGESIANIGKSTQKLEEEQMYYACISDIFDEILA